MKKIDADDLWLEFLVPVKGSNPNDFQICGLCGNHGIVKLGRDKTPAGAELVQSDAYCICPNGRALKMKKGRGRL
jgi:hypothetical protein